MSSVVNTVPQIEPPPLAIAPTRQFLWLVRRELWENRSIYIVPLVAAIVFLLSFVVQTILLRYRMHGIWPSSITKLHEGFSTPYEIAAGLIMGAAFLVGIFYSLDALYSERRDRSILFWKSMPVSDLATVLSKITVPLVILPLLSFAITIVTQILMLLLSSLVLLGSGASIAALWTHSSIFQFSGMLFYHIVTVHGLWYAPIYGWLLFISAWAPRAPFVWAFLPPFLIGGSERIVFHSTHFFNLLLQRLAGPEVPAPRGATVMESMPSLGPLQFSTEPGLWIGLAIAAAFLFAGMRLRRSRGPI
jgi:ABC-2 type transport system permease protein